jgi:micrococcal nuclease
MSKKLLYVSGGIVLFLLALTIKSSYHPAPVVQDNQQKQEAVAVKEESTTNSQKVVATDTKSPSVQEKAPTPSASAEYTYYSVTEVVDGDTIKINMSGIVTTLRLIGLDTPETLDPRKPVQCFGKEASNKAKELLSGKKVRIEKDSTQGELDKYGRTLAYVYREDGLFYNKYMIEQGYAHEYTYNTPYKYQADFKAAEKSARENQRGLWSPNTCNGNTTQAAVSSSASTQTRTENPTPTSAPTTQTSGKFYTSSYGTAKYYYPEACDGWKTLSSSYLKSFNSLQELLNVYPSRTKSPNCQ